jgi:xanthine dehydrogenase accessory factor
MSRGLPLALILGGGELGSAVAHRLVGAGVEVVVVDLPEPTCIRRNVCFAMALVEGRKQVEGVLGLGVDGAAEARKIAASGRVAVTAGDFRELVKPLEPGVIVDARMLKTGKDVPSGLAPLVIGLGPGFSAGDDVDVVVETERGHDLGRVIRKGGAHPDTGRPGVIAGESSRRLVRAPGSGAFRPTVDLGSLVSSGQVIGYVEETEVRAPIDGLLRGLVAAGVRVREGRKMGDVDPRGSAIDPLTISDRGRAVAGGVLEAVMHWWVVKR